MLPPMWTIEACMNIAVNTVSHVGRVFGTAPFPHPIASPVAPLTSVQCTPECVSVYGIAPYLTTSWVSGPLISDPPWRMANRYTTKLARISATVTNGKRSVGMLSLSGIIGQGAAAP